ncbi:MAG TPA: hypothetical protein VN455_13390, partial [Methanotrichaceae archaeon]|nr:hypothetical protein [Methanotrichaceae archaeon]
MAAYIKRRIGGIKWDLLALIAYTALSVLFTYPVAFSTNKIPGEGDVYWYLWDLWWFKKSLSSFISPYYTDLIYHPVGADLAFSEVTPANAIASIPLQFVIGLANTYNLIWLLTFILSGYGTFLLVRYLTGNAKAAFVSGLIFAFCPYRFGHALGHLNLLSTEWMPFYVLYLIRTVREEKRSCAVYAGLFLLLTALSSYYYLVYMLAFTLVYISGQQIMHKNILNSAFLKRFVPGMAFFVVGISPFIYPMARTVSTRGSTFMYLDGFVDYSADLLGLFIPSFFHPLFKYAMVPFYANFTGGPAEFNVFIGYSALALAIIAFLKAKGEDVRFWSLISVSSLILSLGPVLHLNGVVHVPVMGQIHSIPLPYFVLMKIPVFSVFRAPGRWDVLVMLSIAVLSGFGLSYLAARYRAHPNILYLIISCLVLFEYLAVPFPMVSAHVPSFYEQISGEEGDYAILDMPTFISPMISPSEYMYYQTVHGKKLVEGYASRIPDSSSDIINSMPFVTQLMYLPGSRWGKDIMQQNQAERGRDMLKLYN